MPCAASAVAAQEFEVPSSTFRATGRQQLGAAFYHLVGSQFANHFFFVFRFCHGNRLETRGLGILQRQVPESSDADDRHSLVRLGIGNTKSAPHGISRAKNGRGLLIAQGVGDQHGRVREGQHVFGVTALQANAGGNCVLAPFFFAA